METIEIDGSYLEEDRQILMTTLAVSVLKGKGTIFLI